MDELRQTGQFAKPPRITGPGRGRKGEKPRGSKNPDVSRPTLSDQGIDKNLAKRAKETGGPGRGKRGVSKTPRFKEAQRISELPRLLG